MADLRIQRRQRIADPACGTGGFLLGAYQYILTDLVRQKDKKKLEKDEDGFERAAISAVAFYRVNKTLKDIIGTGNDYIKRIKEFKHQIVETTYRIWAMESYFRCGQSLSKLCSSAYPQQLTVKEVHKMHRVLSSPEYIHWPIISVAYHGMREGILKAHPNTWYKYARLMKLKRKKFRKPVHSEWTSQEEIIISRPPKDYPLISIPVVFHVLYNNEPIGTGSNFSSDTITKIIQEVNSRYRNTYYKFLNQNIIRSPNHVDTQIEFRLATYAPDGSILEEPGIVRYGGIDATKWGNDYQLENHYLHLAEVMWPPDQYINISVLNRDSNPVANN